MATAIGSTSPPISTTCRSFERVASNRIEARPRWRLGKLSTILFANERGGGFGHVNRLLALATRLREHRALFVVPDAAFARPGIVAALGAGIEIASFQATLSPQGRTQGDAYARRHPARPRVRRSGKG